MYIASSWVAAFRVASKMDIPQAKIDELVVRMGAAAEDCARVEYHPAEQFFLFPDGTKLVFNHETELAREVD